MSTWMTSAEVLTSFSINVSDIGLEIAREQCLAHAGLALDAEPPSASFQQGVAFQALANWQSTQAVEDDGFGGPTNSVRLYPMDAKIRRLLIVPDPDPDDRHDRSRVGSLIG